MAKTLNPAQFLTALQKGQVPPVSLWIGTENYWRDQCRAALLDKMLPGDLRESGYARHELSELSLVQVLDDAQSMSLFASERVIYVVGAEVALPRMLKSDAATDPALANYLANPAPGVTLVLDCARYALDGEDKAKSDRVRKYYEAVPVVVEFDVPDVAEARHLAESLLGKHDLRLAPGCLELMLEATAGDPARLATEIEKLSLAVGDGGHVSMDLIVDLMPNARASSIFSLVAAIGRNDTAKAFDILDTLVRDGEYLPLALTFLGTQFRLALAAHEAGLKNAGQIQTHFQRLGVPMWRARAEQIAQTAQVFPPAKLKRAIRQTFEADRGLRDARPDDRVILERYLLALR